MKSEREKQISHVNMYIFMWNSEKWYICSYFQNRNRHTDGKNKHMDTKEGSEWWDELGDWG